MAEQREDAARGPFVFLSYARQDYAWVSGLVKAMESHGIVVWRDILIEPGSDFTEAITEAIDRSRCVTVVWSADSIRSRWVREEANEGAQRNILVPILKDRVKPPMGFRGLHYVELLDWNGDPSDPRLHEVLESIEECVRREATPTPPTAGHKLSRKQAASDPTDRRPPPSIRIASLLLVILLAGLIWLVSGEVDRIDFDPATGAPRLVSAPVHDDEIEPPLLRSAVQGLRLVATDPERAMGSFDKDVVNGTLAEKGLSPTKIEALACYAYAALEAGKLQEAERVLKLLRDKYGTNEIPSWLWTQSAYAYARIGIDIFQKVSQFQDASPFGMLPAYIELESQRNAFAQNMNNAISFMLKTRTETTPNLDIRPDLDGKSPRGWFKWVKKGTLDSFVGTDSTIGSNYVALTARNASIAYYRPVNAIVDDWIGLRWMWRVDQMPKDDPGEKAANHPATVLLIFDNLVAVHYVWDLNRAESYMSSLEHEPWIDPLPATAKIKETIRSLRMPTLVLDTGAKPRGEWIARDISFAKLQEKLNEFDELEGYGNPRRLILVGIQVNSQYKGGSEGENVAASSFAKLELYK